jgi:hypothetical protein
MTNSMNKASQCFEAYGSDQLFPARIPAGKNCRPTEMKGGETETVNMEHMSQN